MIHRLKTQPDIKTVEELFIGTDQKWLLSDKWTDTYDHSVLLDKLDPTLRIYCEGEPKPTWRGALHYISVTLFIVAFPYLYPLAGTLPKKLSVVIFTVTNFFCF
mgnify:FL=1